MCGPCGQAIGQRPSSQQCIWYPRIITVASKEDRVVEWLCDGDWNWTAWVQGLPPFLFNYVMWGKLIHPSKTQFFVVPRWHKSNRYQKSNIFGISLTAMLHASFLPSPPSPSHLFSSLDNSEPVILSQVSGLLNHHQPGATCPALHRCKETLCEQAEGKCPVWPHPRCVCPSAALEVPGSEPASGEESTGSISCSHWVILMKQSKQKAA